MEDFVWNWPQITIICLWSLVCVIRGSEAIRQDKSAVEAMFVQACAFGIFGIVLWFGGFWTGGGCPS